MVGQLVVLDVPARWQPLAELAVIVEQDAVGVDDEDRDGEVSEGHARLDWRMGGHRARQSILRSVAGAAGRWEAFAASLLRLDELSVDRLNTAHSTQADGAQAGVACRQLAGHR